MIEITVSLHEEYEAFTQRSLKDLDVVYLFLDAVYEPLRRSGQSAEAILCCWGVLSNGARVLIHLDRAQTESYTAWKDFLTNMVDRGLPTPLTVTTDGSPGLTRAVAAFESDLEDSLAHLKLPAIHRRCVRTTNLIERSVGEERRRTKVIPRLTSEESGLKLFFAMLWRVSERWRSVRFSEHEQRQINKLRASMRDTQDSETQPNTNNVDQRITV